MTRNGAPAIFGRYRGFNSHLKRIIAWVTAIHRQPSNDFSYRLKYFGCQKDLFKKSEDINLHLQEDSLNSLNKKGKISVSLSQAHDDEKI